MPTKTFDRGGAAELPGIRPRTESPMAETLPHTEITPKVIAQGGNSSDQFGLRPGGPPRLRGGGDDELVAAGVNR